MKPHIRRIPVGFGNYVWACGERNADTRNTFCGSNPAEAFESWKAAQPFRRWMEQGMYTPSMTMQ